MKSFIDSDQSLKIGDLVFSSYHKGEYVFRITKIQRRFYKLEDIKYYHPDRDVGDEYNPLMYIEAIENYSLTKYKEKKFRKLKLK